MVKKIIKSKEGIHNRITLKLEQFNLRETKEYLGSIGINWDNKTQNVIWQYETSGTHTSSTTFSHCSISSS